MPASFHVGGMPTAATWPERLLSDQDAVLHGGRPLALTYD